MSAFRVWVVAATATVSSLLAVSASAHVTLANTQAEIDSRYEAVLRIPHGCKGSPTIRLRVRIPDGVIDVQPQDKPDWDVEAIEGMYQQPHLLNGAEITSGIQEVSWSGGPLFDREDAEFVFSAHLSSRLTPNTTLYFPVVQECQRGVERWIDIPAEGSKPADDHSDSPAPGLKLLPKRT
jgi:uncharacterized protein YcnI